MMKPDGDVRIRARPVSCSTVEVDRVLIRRSVDVTPVKVAMSTDPHSSAGQGGVTPVFERRTAGRRLNARCILMDGSHT